MDIVLVLYLIVCIIASIQDIKTREINNFIHVLIILISISSITLDAVIGGIIGFTIFILPNFFKDGSMGGADIKFMFASGLFLGSQKVIIAITLSMVVAIIFTILSNFILNKKEKSIALIPYLSLGCIIAYII